MKKNSKTLDITKDNGKFLITISVCIILIMVMFYFGTNVSKKTYSAAIDGGEGGGGFGAGCDATYPTRVGSYCCKGNAETSYTTTSYFQTESKANSACLEMRSVLYGTSSCSTSKLPTKKPFYNGQFFNSYDDAERACVSELSSGGGGDCSDITEIDAYTYKIAGSFYYARNCKAADTSGETNPLTLSFSDGTLYIGEDSVISATASGGKSPYTIEKSYCSNDTGLSFSSSGGRATFSLVQSSASPNNVICRIYVTDGNGTRVDKSATIHIAYRAYCKNDSGTLKWVTREAYNSAVAVNKSEADCNGCIDGYYEDGGNCVPCTKCEGGACVCDPSKGEYKAEDLAAAASSCTYGYNKISTSKEGCYKFTCKAAPSSKPSSTPSSTSTCDNSTNGKYSTEVKAREDAAKTCATGATINVSKESNGCYKYSCSAVPSNSTSIIVNPPTGNALIMVVWTIGALMIGYTVWYFMNRKDNN